jgi:hypothetical protein
MSNVIFAAGMPWFLKLFALSCLWLTPHYLTLHLNASMYDLLEVVIHVAMLGTLLPATLNSVRNRNKTNSFIVSCILMHSFLLSVHHIARIDDGSNPMDIVSTDHILMLKLHTSYSIALTLSRCKQLVPFNASFVVMHYILALVHLVIIGLRRTKNDTSHISLPSVLFLFFVGEVVGLVVHVLKCTIFIVSELYERSLLQDHETL